MRRFAAALLALTTSCAGAAASAPRTIEVSMHWSRYTPAAITIPVGSTVTFRLHNTDPIDHEFVIGTAAQQLVHESGPPHTHDGKPGQASLGPLEDDLVVYTFTTPGPLLFACHRPGHYAYGMVGAITVTG